MLKDRLEKLRKERRLNRKEVANALKIDQSTYGKYELGKREPDLKTIEALANFFEVTVDYLLGRTGAKKYTSSDEVDGIDEILETLHKRPEMKTLFSLSQKSTKEDIEKAMRIIEALKDE